MAVQAGQTHERYLELLQRSGDPEAFAAGEQVFAEGDHADRMYVVVSGTVSLSTGGRQIELVEPAGIFGELALIDREPRSATAVADTDCALVAIEKSRFWFLVQETPYFAEIVMRVMVSRLRRRTEPAVQLSGR